MSSNMEEGLMRKLTLTFMATALMLAGMAMAANAQNQAPGAARLHAQIQNATPIHQAACNGFTGGCGCAPGWISACPGRCCRCVRCW
jgi:hypothetical protein